MENFTLFLQIGFRHILEGYDHLLFLIGLIIVTGNIKTLLSVTTSFTIAHSTTLILSALNILSVNPAITETLIAASIVYVGVENLISKDQKYRWIIAGSFGFIHGAGFSGHLTGLLRSMMSFGNTLAPLSGFNIGIEAGQIAVIAVVYPLLLYVKRAGKQELILRGTSSLIAVSGLLLLMTRLFGYE